MRRFWDGTKKFLGKIADPLINTVGNYIPGVRMAYHGIKDIFNKNK